jgi:gliding motility-associated-like protein
LGETITKCAQDGAVLNASPSNVDPNSVVYSWFLNGVLIDGETSNTLEAFEEGTYTVEVSDDGCAASDAIDIQFYANENCVISQGISPNGDNLNDILDLEFLNDKSGINKLTVYNRLGTLVYERANYINEWRGQTTDGNELPVGTYFYVITLQRDEPVTGWIYLNK